MKINIGRLNIQKNGLRRAFTLVEMLLVVTIIGILAALVIPKISGTGERARIAAAQADINGGIKTALGNYEVDNGFYPKSLQDLVVAPGNARNWHGPYLEKPPVDPWGFPYVYRFPGRHNPASYDLLSVGYDGKEARPMMLSTGLNKWKRRSAFTLIELILVMALLVVLISMVAPSLSGFIKGRSLDSEAKRMIALMHMAQSRAVSEGMPVVFWVNGKSGQYGVTEETPAAASGDPNAEQLTAADNLQISVLNVGVNAMTTYQNLPAIRFLADGSVDEDSPQMLRVDSADGGSLWLAEMKNRSGYEVRDTAN